MRMLSSWPKPDIMRPQLAQSRKLDARAIARSVEQRCERISAITRTELATAQTKCRFLFEKLQSARHSFAEELKAAEDRHRAEKQLIWRPNKPLVSASFRSVLKEWNASCSTCGPADFPPPPAEPPFASPPGCWWPGPDGAEDPPSATSVRTPDHRRCQADRRAGQPPHRGAPASADRSA